MKVYLTGGSGYVGRVILDRLLEEGHHVVALERPDSQRSLALQTELPQAREDGQLALVAGDLTDPLSLIGTMEDCDAVIHLIGIIREIPNRGITMTNVHVRGTQSLLTEAARCQVKRFLYMSALGARLGATSAYHQSKWAAEEAVRQSGIPYAIFRPSVIFGRGGPGPNFVSQLAHLVKHAPLVPVIGDGNFLLQPVNIQTVAEGFVRALNDAHCTGRAYEVGGPEQISYLDILKQIAEAMHKPLRALRIPLGVVSALAPLLQRLPGFPITTDQLTMLKEGNICRDTESFYQVFGLSPVRFHV